MSSLSIPRRQLEKASQVLTKLSKLQLVVILLDKNLGEWQFVIPQGSGKLKPIPWGSGEIRGVFCFRFGVDLKFLFIEKFFFIFIF